MLIENGNLSKNALAGQVAVVTGAGGGIGYEAARALAWLGSSVVIAEIDPVTGSEAAECINQEFGSRAATFIHTDVGDEGSVDSLVSQAIQSYEKVDIVLNNATVAPLGAVKDAPIEDWDASYRVNLRGPVLLARAFLPGMLARDYGVFGCVSSVGTAFMGPYESMKAAQVHLANTLDAELEGTGVSAFTIGPGFVPTETAVSSIPRLAALMGLELAELQSMLKEQTISVEAAGAGFAAAIALAERYRGQEIFSLVALRDAGIILASAGDPTGESGYSAADFDQIALACRKVRTTLAEQAQGWKKRSIFERQWMIRSFKQKAGMSVEDWLGILERLEGYAAEKDWSGLAKLNPPLDSLRKYYGFLYDTAKGYVKDPVQREEQLSIVRSWQEEVECLISNLVPPITAQF